MITYISLGSVSVSPLNYLIALRLPYDSIIRANDTKNNIELVPLAVSILDSYSRIIGSLKFNKIKANVLILKAV